MSAFSHWDETVPLKIWDGVVARAVHGDEATLAAIQLDPDCVVPEHSHVNEQTGVLLRGSVTFRIGDETKTLTPGAMWVIPAHVPHQVETGPEAAFILELFAPPRTDWGSLERLEPGPPRQ